MVGRNTLVGSFTCIFSLETVQSAGQWWGPVASILFVGEREREKRTLVIWGVYKAILSALSFSLHLSLGVGYYYLPFPILFFVLYTLDYRNRFHHSFVSGLIGVWDFHPFFPFSDFGPDDTTLSDDFFFVSVFLFIWCKVVYMYIGYAYIGMFFQMISVSSIKGFIPFFTWITLLYAIKSLSTRDDEILSYTREKGEIKRSHP